MENNTSTPSAEGAQPPPTAFDVLFEMESGVRAAADLASGIVLMMSGFGRNALEKDEEVHAVLRVAYELRSQAVGVVEDWEKAFNAAKGEQA